AVSASGRETAGRKHLRIDGRTGGMAGGSVWVRVGSRTRDAPERDGGLASIGNIKSGVDVLREPAA
ncbi:hypothetical protein, partial [Ralstonia pseudosolanacearum]